MRAWIAARLSRVRLVWARRQRDREARAELDAHLELLAERYLRRGLPPDEARQAARRQLGNITLVREEVHRMNGVGWLDETLRDLRYAARQIRRAPGFAAVVVGTLALGIGGATAVFSVVEAVLLAPLPYAEPDRLVRLYQQEPNKPDTRYFLTGVHVSFLRDHATSFDAIAALNTYSETGHDFTGGVRPERLRTLEVTSDYFRVLGVALLGPGFSRADETGTRRVVLSDRVWRAHFQAARGVVGTVAQLSGEAYEVAGIAPAGFEDPIAGGIDAWLPYDLAGNTSDQNYSLTGIGRLRPGVTVAQAQSELAALGTTMTARFPGSTRSVVATVPLRADLVASAEAPLHLVVVAMCLVLLVACVNVANLMLVRATGRVHEFAVRAALGSGRARLIRQLLVESALVASLGGLAGLALAGAGLRLLQAVGRDAIPRIDEVGFNPTVLATAALVTMATAIGFGAAPAFRLLRTSPTEALRRQSRSATSGRLQARLRGGLAAAQLALALTLLVGAAVLVVSLHRLQQVDLGIRTNGALTFEVTLPEVRYDPARRAAGREDLARELETLPGVTAAGGISRLPATGNYHPWGTRVLSGPQTGMMISRSRGFNVQQRVISGRLFEALGIPVLAGRVFDARDDASAPPRAVVGAGFAARAFEGWPLANVPGQRVSVLGRELDIIGVVGDVTLDVFGTPALVVYHAHRQFADNRNWALVTVVATSIDPTSILPAARGVVARLDPELVVYDAAPLDEVIGQGSSRQRFTLALMGSFAAVSLLLAALGLYGVLAYSVRQRTREIGVRIALGATASGVRRLVLRQAGTLILVGLVLGLSGAAALGRWLSSLVFAVNPWDWRIMLATACMLAITGLVAAWVPARRASRIAPAIAIHTTD